MNTVCMYVRIYVYVNASVHTYVVGTILTYIHMYIGMSSEINDGIFLTCDCTHLL